MFCTRCGRANRDGAGFCTQCGASLSQVPTAQPLRTPLPTPSRTGSALWIAGVVSFIVVLGIVASVAVYLWALNQSNQSGHVVVEGRTLVGADGNPIELTQNPAATDVTWAQLKQFLSTDQTDAARYRDKSYVCADFAETLHNNAEEAGIRTGYVYIEFVGNPTAHTCNVFQTTDRGIVYVDDTGTIEGGVNADKTVDLAVGKEYCPVSIFPDNDGGTWECMGRVSSFDVTW